MVLSSLRRRLIHKKKLIFFFIFYIKLKGSYHIVSSFEMYIEVGKRIAWNQDGYILTKLQNVAKNV